MACFIKVVMTYALKEDWPLVCSFIVKMLCSMNSLINLTRFAKRGLIHAQFQDTLFIAIC